MKTRAWTILRSFSQFNAVSMLLGGVTTALFAVMLVRVAQVQLRPSEQLRAQMVARTTTRQELPARGDIVDRRGRLVASTSFARRVVIDPTVFGASDTLDEDIARLASAAGLDTDKLDARIRKAIEANVARARSRAEWDAVQKHDGAKTAAGAAPGAGTDSSANSGTNSPANSGTSGQPNAATDANAPAASGDASPSDDHTATRAASILQNDPEWDPFAAAQAAEEESVQDAAQNSRAALESAIAKDSANASTDAAASALSEAGSSDASKPPKLIRYLPVSDLLSEDQELAVRAAMKSTKERAGLRGIVLERQQVREFAGGDILAPLVGKVGYGHEGVMGAESRLNDELDGDAGKLTYVRDHAGRPLWIESAGLQRAKPGETVRLSIDAEVQRIAFEEVQRQVEDTNAAGGRCVIVDPASGEVLALVDIVRDVPEALPFPWADAIAPGQAKSAPNTTFDPEARYQVIKPDPARAIHPALARNRCVEDIYEPGSTFKPFVWSVITELGRARMDEVFNTENGKWWTPDHRYLEDVTKRATMVWPDVLVNSSNIGMVKAGTRLSPSELHDVCTRFGFGTRTKLGLGGEAAGIVTPMSRWKVSTHTSVSYGHEIGVTPIQMVRAFSVFARDGNLAGTLPSLRLQAMDEGEAQPVSYRVLPPQVALTTRNTLKGVVDVLDRNGAKKDMPEGGWRYNIFGKSGTAKIPVGAPPPGKRLPANCKGYYAKQYISSFLAGGPVESPKLVCIVIIDDPRPKTGARAHLGSYAAGPAARRILDRALTYLGVPASPPAILPNAR